MSGLPVLQDPPAVHVAGEIERALLALWPVARERLWQPRHLAAIVRLRRRFALRPLRLGELKVMAPRSTVPDCEACTDICCTGSNARVSLRLRDIAALVDRGLDAHITHDLPDGKLRTATWARREADGSVFHRAFPVLSRDATQTCTLLTGDRTCGAFPDWPLSCARYPYALDLESKVVFYAKSCQSTQLLPAGEAAPRVQSLVRAVVDAYNARIQDVVMLHLARTELAELGLLRFVNLDALDA